MRRFLIGLIVVAGAIVSASANGAGNSPSNAVYNSTGPKTQHGIGKFKPPVAQPPSNAPTTAGAPLAAAAPSSQLPFTGLDLTLIVAAGFVLLAMGIALRLITRKPPS